MKMDRKMGLVQIPGTKYVSQSSQMIVSSGIPALDEILGGGLPVGTVALIEEDMYGTYAKVMLKYFVAEGVVCKHSVFLASQDSSPYEVIKEIPAVINFDQENSTNLCETKSTDTKMKIAFRYEKLPCQNDGKEEHITFGHFYDLTKYMSLTDIENTDIYYWNGCRVENCVSSFSNPAYNDLLRQIKTKIKNDKYFLKDNPSKNSILRIALHSLGSPMWLPVKNSLHSLDTSRDLDKFIFCLRALVRSALAVAVITIPSHLYREHALERCIHSSDISMRLKSFAGTELETNKVLSDYHGFFQVTKLAPINSFASKHPGSLEYVFKLRRKKFVIEKLHLPPDIEENDNSKKEKIATPGCFGTNKQLLDF